MHCVTNVIHANHTKFAYGRFVFSQVRIDVSNFFQLRSFSFLQTSLVYFEDLKCDIDFSVMNGTIFTNIMCFSN